MRKLGLLFIGLHLAVHVTLPVLDILLHAGMLLVFWPSKGAPHA